MSVIILPRNTGLTSSVEAQARLKATIDDPYTAVAIVNGEGPEIDKVIEVCSARAGANVLRRRVVWIPDSSVLAPEQKDKYCPSGFAAVFIDLDDNVAERLTVDDAQLTMKVERAFTHAGG